MADAAGQKTETTVRQYDASGALVSETVTTVMVSTPEDDGPVPGMYL